MSVDRGASFLPRRALLPLLLVLGWLLLFADVIGPWDGLYYRDHFLAFRPYWWSIVEQLSQGTLPTVDLSHPLGLPHEKTTSYALFTPATLFLFLGPFEHSYDLFVAAHFLILGTGALSLSRALGATGAEALAAAGVAMLAGPVVSFENLVVGLQGLAWTPWLWWALLTSMRAPGWRSTGALSLALFLAVQGIMPELVLLDFLALAALVGGERPRWSRRLLATWLGSLLLASLAATIDVVPLLEALRGSRRLQGLSYAEQSGWALTPGQLLELVVPSFWTRPSISYFNIPRITGATEDPPYLASLYLGASLALGLSAPFRTKARLRWALVGMGIFLVVAMGRHLPVHRLLVALPGFGSTRYAVKYTLFLVPALALLVASAIRNLDEAGAKRAMVLFGLQTVLLAALGRALFMPELISLIDAWARPYGNLVPHVGQENALELMLPSMRWGVLHAGGAALLGFLVAFAASSRRLSLSKARWALALVLLVDLAVAGRRGIPLARTAMDPEVQAAWAGIAPERPWLWIPGPRPVVELGRSPFESSLLQRRRVGRQAWTSARVFELEELEGLGVDPLRRVFQRTVEQVSTSSRARALLGPVLAQAGVAGLVYEGEWSAPVRFSLPRPDEGRTYFYALDTWAPAELRTRWRPATLDSLLKEGLRVSDLLEGVVLTEEAPRPDIETCSGAVEALERGPGWLRARVRAECPAFFVVNEVAHEGWVADVDGEATAWTRADAGALAVPVDAGAHEVSAEYRTTTARWLPVALPAVTFALLLVILGGRWDSAKRSSALDR